MRMGQLMALSGRGLRAISTHPMTEGVGQLRVLRVLGPPGHSNPALARECWPAHGVARVSLRVSHLQSLSEGVGQLTPLQKLASRGTHARAVVDGPGRVLSLGAGQPGSSPVSIDQIMVWWPGAGTRVAKGRYPGGRGHGGCKLYPGSFALGPGGGGPMPCWPGAAWRPANAGRLSHVGGPWASKRPAQQRPGEH